MDELQTKLDLLKTGVYRTGSSYLQHPRNNLRSLAFPWRQAAWARHPPRLAAEPSLTPGVRTTICHFGGRLSRIAADAFYAYRQRAVEERSHGTTFTPALPKNTSCGSRI